MPADSALVVVQTDVIAFDKHLRPICAAFFGFDVPMSTVKKVVPDLLACSKVVSKKVFGRTTEHGLMGVTVLIEESLVGFGDALMVKDVLEQRVLINTVMPCDGFASM